MLDRETWADVLTGSTSFADAVTAGRISIDGDPEAVLAAIACFDPPFGS